MQKEYLRPRLVGLAFIGAVIAMPALASPVTFNVNLDGASQVPPVDTSATGLAEITFDPDTNVLTWSVNVLPLIVRMIFHLMAGYVMKPLRMD